MIRPCREEEFETVYEIVNDAAEAYRDAIPADRWKDPYMPREELRHEMNAGVVFWGCEVDGRLLGVMGVQDLGEVTLIRHAYVRTSQRRMGLGGRLLQAHLEKIRTPTLIGTWASAAWAVRFYQKHGFRLVSHGEKERLLRRYWSIPERQVETSVVLGDTRWFQSALCQE
jgi:GNAT superfamily N-acetyltransferase